MNFLTELTKNKPQQHLFLILTILAGCVLLAPYHNFQDYLAQGDHGRDLYAFEQILSGGQPYKDYWWVYGPLMILYYGLFNLLLGISIHSILIGKLLLNLIAGTLIYGAMALFFSPFLSFLTALWFWIFNADFFFTYNHVGGIVMVNLAFYALNLYLKDAQPRYLFWALGSLFLLAFIKINFAFSSLAALLISVFLIDKFKKNNFGAAKKYFYAAAILLFPAAVLGIYSWLVRGLTIHEIRQCFPYWGGDQPYETSPVKALQVLFEITWNNIKLVLANKVFAVVLNLSIFYSVFLLIKGKIESNKRMDIILFIGILIIFYLTSMHEFLRSGVLYRSFWAKPFQLMLMFSFIAVATLQISRVWKNFLYGCFLLVGLSQFWPQFKIIEHYKTPGHFLTYPKGQVYVGNDINWIKTVDVTTEFLTSHLQNNETFFALPYDCLYYYLTGKKSPTRQLIFFEHIKIPTEQEKRIIDELKNQNVAYVVLSSRFSSAEQGLGILGQTYCPLIAQYINNNYEPAVRIGDWMNPPGWAWNHGTLILKKKAL